MGMPAQGGGQSMGAPGQQQNYGSASIDSVLASIFGPMSQQQQPQQRYPMPGQGQGRPMPGMGFPPAPQSLGQNRIMPIDQGMGAMMPGYPMSKSQPLDYGTGGQLPPGVTPFMNPYMNRDMGDFMNRPMTGGPGAPPPREMLQPMPQQPQQPMRPPQPQFQKGDFMGFEDTGNDMENPFSQSVTFDRVPGGKPGIDYPVAAQYFTSRRKAPGKTWSYSENKLVDLPEFVPDAPDTKYAIGEFPSRPSTSQMQKFIGKRPTAAEDKEGRYGTWSRGMYTPNPNIMFIPPDADKETFYRYGVKKPRFKS